MKGFYMFIACILMINLCSAQIPYIDIPGWGARFGEKSAVRSFQKQSLKTTASFGATATMAASEKLTRTRLVFNPLTAAFINYFKYDKMCSSYLNPFKKSKCRNRYNYLKNAHQKILELVSIPAMNSVNNGVREQITQKYTHITNMILKELEMMKIKAEKDNFYTRLLIR